MRFQPTPNPNAVKVLLPRRVVDGTLVVVKPEDAKGNALALELLALDGVRDLFFLHDFVTVSRTPDVAWETLKPKIEAVVHKHLG